MAIAQTATAISAGFDNSNPVTMAFDCNGGNLLVVGLYVFSSPRAGTAPTYNGVAMTDSGEGQVDSTGESIVEMWYLPSPAGGGAHDISIPNTSSGELVLTASAWSGVDVADPLDIAESDFNAASANPSVTITTSAADKLIIDTMMDGNGTIPSANTHTLIFSQDNGSSSSNTQYTLNDGSAGITLGWTELADDWAMIVCAFNPAGGVTYFATLAVTATGTLIFSRWLDIFRVLALNATGTPTFSRWLDLKRTLPLTATAVATFSEHLIFRVTLAVTATAAATFSRLMTFKRSFAMTATGTPAFARVLALERTLAITATGIATFSRKLTFKRALTLTATVIPTLIGRLIEEIILVCDEAVSWFLPRKTVASRIDSKTNKVSYVIAAKSVRIEMPDKTVEVIECPT